MLEDADLAVRVVLVLLVVSDELLDLAASRAVQDLQLVVLAGPAARRVLCSTQTHTHTHASHASTALLVTSTCTYMYMYVYNIHVSTSTNVLRVKRDICLPITYCMS